MDSFSERYKYLYNMDGSMATKTITLTYSIDDFKEIDKIKKASGKPWEQFILDSVRLAASIKEGVN